MIQRVCEQQLPISGVLLQRRDLVHLEISPDEWRILEDIIKLLEPFKIATQHLSGERYPTVSALGPLLKQIQKKMSMIVLLCVNSRRLYEMTWIADTGIQMYNYCFTSLRFWTPGLNH